MTTYNNISQQEHTCILLTPHPVPNFNAGRATNISVSGRRRAKHTLDLGGRTAHTLAPVQADSEMQVSYITCQVKNLKDNSKETKGTKQGDLPILPNPVLT